MHFLLTYEYTDDYLQRREQFRAEHLKLGWDAVERGEMLMAGTVGEPIDSALFVFTIDGPEPAAAFALADPYVKHGLVKHWSVRKWNTVIGEQATTPIR